MKKRRVLFTNIAINDLADIEEYIESAFSENVLYEFKEKVKETISHLEKMAGTYGKTDLFIRNYLIYKWVLRPSVFFYVIKEPENEVHIIRVQREESDWYNNLFKPFSREEIYEELKQSGAC